MLPIWCFDLLLQAAPVPPAGGGAADGAPADGMPPPDFWSIARSMLPMLIIMMGIFWILVWRPESRKRREREQMVKNLKKGDTVVTMGGIIGRVWKADGPEIVVIVDKDKEVKIRFSRSAVAEVLKVDSSAQPAQNGASEPTESAKS